MEKINSAYEQGFNDCKRITVEILGEMGDGTDKEAYDFIGVIINTIQKLDSKNSEKYKKFMKLPDKIVKIQEELSGMEGLPLKELGKLSPYDYFLSLNLDEINNPVIEEAAIDEPVTDVPF